MLLREGSVWSQTDPVRSYLTNQNSVAAYPFGQMNTEAAAISAVAMSGGLHPDLIAENLERALSVDPNSPNLWFHLTIQDMARGEWMLVRRDMERFAELAQPKDIETLKAIYFLNVPTPL